MKKTLLLLLLSIAFANSSVVELTDKNFENKIKENNQTIVMFHAPWCGACKIMKPDYAKLSETFKGRINFTLINTDEQKKISKKYNINSLPTSIIFENGKEIKRQVGSLSRDEIKMFIDPIESIKKQHKKCMDGNSTSCIELAGFYEENGDYNKTIAYYKEACVLDADGCSYVADIYYYEKIVKKDYPQALIFYEKACSGEDFYGCNSVGRMYDKGEGTTINHEESAKFYRKACQGKDVWGCCNLGYSYYDGEGVKQNYTEALKYYKLACDSYFSYDISGSANACNQIGQIYRNGRGVTKDYKKAFQYYKKSCSQDNAIGCSNLGDMYKGGLGIDKNITKSIEFYEISCNENRLSACTNLADLYYEGEEVTQNYDKAKQYFEQACDSDSGYGCYSLGYMYEYGDGKLDINDIKALTFYENACHLGYKDACKVIKDLTNSEKNSGKYTTIVVVILVLGIFFLFIFLHSRQKRVILKNKEFNVQKEVPFLFSWSMLIFGSFIPLFRADFIWFTLSLILHIGTSGLGTIILAFFYNKIYIKSLLKRGYEPADDESKALLDSKGIIYKLSNAYDEENKED